jgi:hypothetical protein
MDDRTDPQSRWRYVISKIIDMGLFKRKSPVDKLYDKHEKLLKEAHALSTSNRSASDAKVAEAEAVMKEIEKLEKNG